MKIKKADYVIIETDDKKRTALAKVKQVDGDIVNILYVENQHIQELRHSEEVDVKYVLINLGPNPRAGKVYGCDTAMLYRGHTEHERFGKLYWFYEPEKDVRKSVNTALNITFKNLKKFGLEGLAEDEIIWEMHPAGKQRWAGRYLHPKKGRSRIQIAPEHDAPSNYPLLFAHELGHRLHRAWLRSMEIESEWIKLYNTSIKITEVDQKITRRFLKNLTQDFTLSHLKGSLDDDDEKLALTAILRKIKATHGLSPKELNILLKTGEVEEVASVWPTHIERKDLKPVITEYATVAYTETIAESFAYHVCGMTLPKSVVKLTEKTISSAKHNLLHGPDEEQSGDDDE